MCVCVCVCVCVNKLKHLILKTHHMICLPDSQFLLQFQAIMIMECLLCYLLCCLLCLHVLLFEHLHQLDTSSFRNTPANMTLV